MTFNHAKAQEYELKANVRYLDNGNYEAIVADIKSNHARGYACPHYLNKFFKNDINVFNEFVERVKDHNALEVSSGILGMMPLWGNWIKGERFALDPLALQYHYELHARGWSWFEGVQLLPYRAEDIIPEIVGKITGFIMWHNGLDHLEDPVKAIEVVSTYAAPGCLLYFQTDIKHPQKPDIGHRDICEIIPDVGAEIMKHGWRLLYLGNADHEGHEEYLGVFLKG